MMKFIFIIVFICAASVQCDDDPVDIWAALDKCTVYVGADADDLQAIDNLTITTCTQKCLLYCSYHEMGLMNGTEIGPFDVLLALHREVQANNPSVLKHATTNVETCLKEANEMKYTNDPCLIAATYEICIRNLANEELEEDED